MSWYCIHEKTCAGSYYESPESWYDFDEDYDCENCPHRYSKENYEADCADYEDESY